MRPTNVPCPGQDVGLRHGWTAPHPGARDLFRQSVNFTSETCQFLQFPPVHTKCKIWIKYPWDDRRFVRHLGNVR